MLNIDQFRPEAVVEDAKKLLHQVGMTVTDPRIHRRIDGDLMRDGETVRFPLPIIDRFVDEIRGGDVAPAPTVDVVPRIHLFHSGVHFKYHDAATGTIRPYDTESLARHSRYILQLGREGVFHGRTPGYPVDVAPSLQFLTAFYIDCLYNPHPSGLGLSSTIPAMRYEMEMARAMGLGHSFCVEPISPMRVIGNSVEAAIDLWEPGMGVSVDPMPVMGVTAPLDWHAAWAQSVAENIGTVILLRFCGIEGADPSFRLFAPNFVTGMAYFSSPLHLLALLTRRKVREFFGRATEGGELLLVSSKAPDAQAAAEKTAGCLAGAMNGFRYLEGAGALYIDVVFSPQQLRIDLEIRNYVEAMLNDVGEFDGDVVEEVRKGVRGGGYLAADRTLADYSGYMWRPRLFDLTTLRDDFESRILAKAADPDVDVVASRYDYELLDSRREAIERIMEKARRSPDSFDA